jgi:chromosome segregation ATPase
MESEWMDVGINDMYGDVRRIENPMLLRRLLVNAVDTIDSLRTSMNDKDKRCRDLELCLNMKKDECSSLKQTIATHKAQRDTLTQQLSLSQEQYNSKDKKCCDLDLRLNMKKGECTSLKQTIAILDARCSTLTQQLRLSQEQYDRLCVQTMRISSLLTTVKQQNAALELQSRQYQCQQQQQQSQILTVSQPQVRNDIERKKDNPGSKKNRKNKRRD